MSSALAIHVRFHDGRYHGDSDWPPCPARLFQALVSGAGLSGPISEKFSNALKWLESIPPPLIGAPQAQRGQRVMFYMPNNDMDIVGGDPLRIAEIRTAKKYFHPYLFDLNIPFLFLWQNITDEHTHYANEICEAAYHLYQLGRGIDMAWAWADLLNMAKVDELLASYPGQIHRPSTGIGENHTNTLLCPHPGSLESICKRYQAYSHRFMIARKGKTVKQTFQKAPQASFRSVSYDNPPTRYIYELRRSPDPLLFFPWPLSEVSKLIVCLRDGAVDRLKTALPDQAAQIDRVLVGRKSDGTNAGSTAERVRIIPLPSVGHPHADHAIRRILVEVPAACPLRADDVSWAFSALVEPVDIATGEIYPLVLISTADENILRHFGMGENSEASVWRTITPIAVPEVAGRRRIEPTIQLAQAKSGAERVYEQHIAAASIIQALRHAEIREQPVAVKVQREPFEGNGERVEAFANRTRFYSRSLWHAEITFLKPLSGPLVVGDGRFFGLGVMVPNALKRTHVAQFVLDSTVLPQITEALPVAESARRILMGIGGRMFSAPDGSRGRSDVFSGKNENGRPLEGHGHAYYLPTDEDQDGYIDHLTIIAVGGFNEQDLKVLDALRELKSKEREASGHPLRTLLIGIGRLDEYRPYLMQPSRIWRSATPFIASRFLKKRGTKRDPVEFWNNPHDFLIAVLREEMARFIARRFELKDLNPDKIKIRPLLDENSVFRIGRQNLRPIQFKRFRQKKGDDGGNRPAGSFEIDFGRDVSGPIALGHSSHFGLGLFVPVNEQNESGDGTVINDPIIGMI